jgi:hypothetical protein
VKPSALAVVLNCIDETSNLTPHGTGPVGERFLSMSDKRLPLYGLRVRLSTDRRFRWDILADGQPIQSSPESFGTKEEAQASGFAEIEKLIWTRCSH